MQYETRVFHPIVEKRLKELKWRYRHELPISENGAKKIDFLAFNGEHYFIIECKTDHRYIWRGVNQGLDYYRLLRGNGEIFDIRDDSRLDHFTRQARRSGLPVEVWVIIPSLIYNETEAQDALLQGVTILPFDLPIEAKNTFLKPRR